MSVSSGYPNTSNLMKNPPLQVICLTLFSVFGYPDETLSLVFDILLNTYALCITVRRYIYAITFPSLCLLHVNVNPLLTQLISCDCHSFYIPLHKKFLPNIVRAKISKRWCCWWALSQCVSICFVISLVSFSSHSNVPIVSTSMCLSAATFIAS